jgi:cellulose synthase/poly-beta-1,6-N-acetylglucosamine synthase-like glycosyltransferase
MLKRTRSTLAFLNQHSLALFAAGALAAGAYNLWKWRQDARRAARFAAGRGADPPLDSHEQVSVLVAAWNEAENIPRHVQSFLALRYPHKELVLCAGGQDQTYPLACSYSGPSVIVLPQQPGEGKQAALRRGLEYTHGTVIFLTDADCFLDDRSFEGTLRPVLCGDEAAATGASRPPAEQWRSVFVASQAIPPLYAALWAPEYSSGLLGRNSAVRKAVLVQARGLEQEAPTGTDYVLAKRLLTHGARIRQVAGSLVPSRFPGGVRAYLRQQRRWQRNVAFYGRRLGAPEETRAALVNSLTGLGMLLLPWAGPAGFPFLGALWAALYLYALFSRLRYAWAVRRAFGLQLPRGLAAFQPWMLWIDFWAWSLPLWAALRRPRRENW